MDKKKVVEFIREHKGEIIVGTAAVIGTAALMAIGWKSGLPTTFTNWKQNNTDAVKFIETVDDCCEGCTVYNRVLIKDLQSIIDRGVDITNTPLRDPNGEQMMVKNIIVFGNKVEP